MVTLFVLRVWIPLTTEFTPSIYCFVNVQLREYSAGVCLGQLARYQSPVRFSIDFSRSKSDEESNLLILDSFVISERWC
jgi:hypothetical protein